MKLKYKIWLDNEGKAFGEGPYQLLAGVKSTGSLAQAAKDLNMSYSRAHGLMKYLSNQLGFPLIESQAGGVGGGGARVTAEAEDLMRRYDSFMRESVGSLEKIFARHFPAEAVAETPTQPEPESREEPMPLPTDEEEPPEQQTVTLSTKLKPLQLSGREVVSLTGGGGKTSIMYALAEELSAGGVKVLLTTTTKIHLPSHGTVNRLIISGEQGIIDQLKQGVKPKEIVALGSGVRDGKLQGLSPEFIDRLADMAIADYILVEADGAAMKPFKAPAEHEPMIPQSSTMVLNIAGLDALGEPLTEEHFHRVAEICTICGLPPGATMDSQAMASVMYSAAGGRKQVPRGAQWLPVINKIDSDEDLPKAKQLALDLVRAGARDVVFASTLRSLKVSLWSTYARS